MPLDPQAAEVIKMMSVMGPLKDMDLQAMRQINLFDSLEEVCPVGSVEDIVIPAEGRDIAARIYVPEDGAAPPPLLLFYHGGGWVLGGLDTHDDTCRQLCRRVGAVVASIDYRLAPEHSFPAAPEDCFSALCWVAANAQRWGADANRVAVVGDSAGGNLAAVTTLMARERGGPRITHQTLIYPVTDCNFDTDSYRDNAEGYFLTTEDMRWCWQQYLGERGSADDPLASPLKAPTLAGLPPATIVSAEYDPLRDDAAAYAERLRADGVAVSYRCCDGMIHGFIGFSRMIDGAEEAWRMIAEELRRALN